MTVAFADITSALESTFYDDISNQINRACVLGQVLEVKQGTGKNIQWLARTGTATPTTAVIGDGVDVSVFNADSKTPAVLQYGTYHDAFALTGKAMAAARAAGNPAELAALLVEMMGESVERLARAIAYDAYNGSAATDNMWGLYSSGSVQALGNTGVYASIDRSSFSQWQSNVVDAAGGQLSWTLLRDLRRVIAVASGEKPDIFITDPVQHEKLGLLYQTERRYVDTLRLNNGSVIKLDGGYSMLEFDGVGVIEDPIHPANTFTALNSRHVFMSQMADSPDAMARAMGSVQLAGTPEEIYGNAKIKLSARINPLAVTGDAFKYQLICYPQIVVRRPNACGQIKNLAS